MDKLSKIAPKGVRSRWFLLIRMMQTFWVAQIVILRISLYIQLPRSRALVPARCPTRSHGSSKLFLAALRPH